MSEATITVDSDIAEKYNTAPEADRQKIQLLIRLFLQDMIVPNSLSFQQIMDAIGYEAQRRGLTPEILDEMLNNDE
jgi:hypothetical protein